MPTSGARNANGALSGPNARFQAQKTTPKATPRTAVTTMSTVRQRTVARPLVSVVPVDGGRTAESAMIPPDSLRRHDPDQVRGSAVARTLSAEALPCRCFLLCRETSPRERVRTFRGSWRARPARLCGHIAREFVHTFGGEAAAGILELSSTLREGRAAPPEARSTPCPSSA